MAEDSQTPVELRRREWKTWHVAVTALIALLLGVGIGVAGGARDDQSLATGASGSTSTSEVPRTLATTTISTRQSTTTVTPTTIRSFPVGEQQIFRDGTKLTVYAYTESNLSARFSQPNAGYHWAAVDFQACAGSNQFSVNRLYLILSMPDNSRIQRDGTTTRAPDLSSADLPAGECVRGWLTYQVPDGSRPSTIIWDDPQRFAKWTV